MRSNDVVRSIIVVITTLVIAACGALTKTPYVRPLLVVPTSWREQDSHARAIVSADPWWHAFGDTPLDGLIDRVLRGNQDLAVAALHIKLARQEFDLARTNALPVLGLNVSAQTSRNLTGRANTSKSSGVDASVSYEVDLWGTLASQRDAASWEARATEQDRESLLLQLVGTTIDLYWQMAYLSQQLDQSQQSIAYAQETVQLATVQYQAGAISAIDRLAAENALAEQHANQALLLDQQTQADNAMALLVGDAPGQHFVVPASALNRPLPEVAVGIPAELLTRRPDLQAADMRLREALDQADAARTSFFPTMTLTGAAGTSSDTLVHFLQDPVGTAAATMTAPFLNWRMRDATVGAAKTSYHVAAVAFQKTFYQALQDVDNALAARTDYRVQLVQLTEAHHVAQESERRYRDDYEAGAVSLQTLLDAQQATRNAETAMAAARYGQLVSQVTLYQALGGSASAPLR